MSLLTVLIVKNSHIFAGIFFIFLKKRHGPNLKAFNIKFDTYIVKQIKFKGVWARKKQKLFAETTIHKILETNSRFYVKQHNA